MKAFIIYKHLLDLDGNNFVIGGIETYLENLAQVIIKLGISPVIVQCANKDFSKGRRDSILWIQAFYQ